MRRQNTHAIMGIGLLALGVCATAIPALAQGYPSARKADDNGSVNEPGPAAGNAAATRQPVRGGRLVNNYNYRAPAPQHQAYPSARRADDNGSVEEPSPSR